MMNQKKSSKSTVLKYLLIVPLTFLLIVISNAESLATKTTELLQTEKTALSGLEEATNALTGQDEKPIFMVVEEMPQYPGGDQELFKYLAENIKYPASAHTKGIQGRVICQFVVNDDGAIQDVAVVRGVDPDLDAEAVRVVGSMPEWIPGKQRGVNVRVKYTLPINFRLQQSKDTANIKGFAMFMHITEDEIKLESKQGSAWQTLRFSIKEGVPQAIDEYGMTPLDKVLTAKNAALADYLFTITKINGGIFLKSIEGTAWKELHVEPVENRQYVLNHYGIYWE